MLKRHFVDVSKCSFNYFKGALWRGMHVCIDIICIDVCMILNRSDQTKHRGPLSVTGLHTSKDPRQRKDIVRAIFCMDSNCTKMSLLLFLMIMMLFVGGGDGDIFTNSSHGDYQIKTSVIHVCVFHLLS